MANALEQSLGKEGVQKLLELLGDAVGGAGVQGGSGVERVDGEVPVVRDAGGDGGGGPVEALSSVVGAEPVVGLGGGACAVAHETGSESWSDMMESESSGTSVKGVPLVSEEVKKRVVFGGFGSVGVQSVETAPETKGLMSQYVRTDRAKALRHHLQSFGISMPKTAAYSVALVTHSAATMPAFFHDGKDKLRSYAVLGDAALSAAVAAESIACGRRLESLQHLRTTALTDGHMQDVFFRSPFVADVTFAAGVHPKHAKSGATALEAIVGVVAFWRQPADVVALARQLGLVAFA